MIRKKRHACRRRIEHAQLEGLPDFAFPSWAVACHAVANISAMAMLAAIELAFLLCIVSLRQISTPNCSGEAYLAKNRYNAQNPPSDRRTANRRRKLVLGPGFNS